MSIAIIGDPKKANEYMPLVNKAGDIFDKFLYAPINEIRVKTGRTSRILHRRVDLLSFGCTSIDNVASFDNRIHVHCATSNGSIEYYAYPTSGSNGYTANRMLAVGQTAFALGKGVVIFYQSSTSYNPPGCNTGDCRLLTGLSMLK